MPYGWAITPLSMLGELRLGKMLDKTKNHGDTVQYLRNVNVRWFEFDIADLKDIRVSDKERDLLSVQDGDLFICEGGEPGRCAVWRAGANSLVYQKALHRFRTNGAIAPEFLMYRLRHDIEANVLQSAFTGTTIKHLTRERLAKHLVPLPAIAEQIRIAAQLDKLLARIQTCNDRIDAIPALLKRFRQAVLTAATSGALTEDWRAQRETRVARMEPSAESGNFVRDSGQRSYQVTPTPDSASLHPGYVAQSKQQLTPDAVMAARRCVVGHTEKRSVIDFLANHHPKRADKNLPDSWLIAHVGTVGIVSNGSTPSRKENSFWNGDIPWVSSGEVANGVISRTKERITDAGFRNSSVRLLPKGTVLVAMIGEGKTRGQSALLLIDACINQNIAAVVPFAEIVQSEYLWFWFQSQYENTRTKGNGSGPKALNCERVRELEVYLPPLAEQSEIIRRVEALFKLADRIESRYKAARTQAQRLTPLLLAKAFRGELVPQDPNDEPASVLLERIDALRSELMARKICSDHKLHCSQ